jgi:nucleoside-diphosphate-sugar epimerase
MKVLLAGATGAVGRPLLRALAAGGHPVIAVIRNPVNRQIVNDLGAVAVVANVMDRDGLLRAVDGLSADVVIHQATALRNAGRTIRLDDPTIALRHTGSAHLLEAAAVVGAGRFVTQSLITGYGYRDHGRIVLTEDHRFGELAGNAADAVVESTVAAEEQAFAASGIEGIALRYGMFYGPNAFSDKFAGLMRRRLPVIPWGETGFTCFIHVDDAASAAVAAMERGRPGQAYNIVDDEPATWRQFVTAVAATHGTPRPMSVPAWLFRRMVPYLGCLMIDTSMRVSRAKATHELGWNPLIPNLQVGLASGTDERAR